MLDIILSIMFFISVPLIAKIIIAVYELTYELIYEIDKYYIKKRLSKND